VVVFCESSVSIDCVEVLEYLRLWASQKGLCSLESNSYWTWG